LIFSQNQNADSEVTIKLLKLTGLSAPRNHQLSMSKNTMHPRLSHVFFAKILHRLRKLKLFLSVYLFLESSMMCTHLYHIGTTIKFSFPIFIHDTDLRTVTQSSKYGVTTSWILVMISDATSVPDPRKQTSCILLTYGADQLTLTSSVKLSHFQFH
jgi:hypothetical protein